MSDCIDAAEAHQIATPGTPKDRPGVDLLQIGLIRRVIRWPAFPYTIQALVLAAFLGLAWYGWGRFAPPGVPPKLYAQTNLVNLLIWGLWWPAVVWLTVLLGRVWCMVCPLELVATRAEALARRAGLRGRPLSPWLRHGWLMLALFAAIQMLVPGIQIHRVPAYTSIFMFTLVGLAVAVGTVWRDRAFCRGFCPVGLLLRVYGRGGMLAVRATPPHAPHANLAAEPHSPSPCGGAKPTPCPSLLNPGRLDRSNDCLICCQCLKAMPPGSMGLYLRRPFARADSREPLATWPVTLFVVLVSGFVISELCSEWPAAQAAFKGVPQHAAAAAGLDKWSGWIEGLWTLGVVPSVVWGLLAGLTVAVRAATRMGDALRRIALPLAVVVAAGHLSKALAKGTSWAGFLPKAMADPSGVTTAMGIHAKTLAPVLPLVPMPVVSAAALALVMLGVVLALREFRLAGAERPERFAFPTLALGGLFAFLVVGWGLLG